MLDTSSLRFPNRPRAVTNCKSSTTTSAKCLSRANRRAFAAISNTLADAESSIHSGASANSFNDTAPFPQSSCFTKPVLNLCASTCACEARSRSSSDSFDISRLDTTTVCRFRTATFGDVKASAVFPSTAATPK